ncbi:hypothetical protein C2G38_2169795 [Gigaspora rosea]|uniref:Uncharacterized protein n=1 Tax=Gigaspora rosea TaxID=44941 RepID=A0A397VQD1_9GLOM|nr:hypothetical protein C2G38_2169795 [Gigaspora rosea]
MPVAFTDVVKVEKDEDKKECNLRCQYVFAHAQAIHNINLKTIEYLEASMFVPWYWVLPPIVSYLMIQMIRPTKSQSKLNGFYFVNSLLGLLYIVGSLCLLIFKSENFKVLGSFISTIRCQRGNIKDDIPPFYDEERNAYKRKSDEPNVSNNATDP